LIQKLETHYDNRRVNYGSGVRLPMHDKRPSIRNNHFPGGRGRVLAGALFGPPGLNVR
jgi:hypothetical protein